MKTCHLEAAAVHVWDVPRRGDVAGILAKYLPIGEINLERDAYGKPFIFGHPLHFNVSHVGDKTLLAIADSAVGIDIERIDRPPEQLAGLLHYFTATERDALGVLNSATRGRLIIQCWTRKEAFAKAIGRGLRVGLDTFAVFTNNPAAAELSGTQTQGWQVIDLEAPPGYAAAVALPAGKIVRRMGTTAG